VVSNLLYFHPWGRFPFWQTYFSTGWFNHQLDHRRCWPPARQKACLVPTAATAESLGLPGVVLTDKNHGMTDKTRWWFQIFIFSPLLGEMIQFDWYFSDGLKPPTRKLPSKNRRLKLKKILRCILRKAAILMCACMWGMKHLWRRRVFKKTRCAMLFFLHPIRALSCSCQLFCLFLFSSGREKLMSTTMDEMRSLGCTVTFYVLQNLDSGKMGIRILLPRAV